MKVYTRMFTPGSAMELDEYERLREETGLIGDALRRAWDAKILLRRHPSRKRELPPPPPKKPPADEIVMDRINKLRRKANDPAVTTAESQAFHAKADALLNRYRRV